LQLFVEEAVLAQLNLVINLTFPVSLENEALSNKPDEEEQEAEVQAPEIQANEGAVEPNDTTAELAGNR